MDVLGTAIKDFWLGDRKNKLWVHDHFGPRVEMNREIYFRNWDNMPKWEQLALKHCYGKILDVGAGAGAHSLALQQMNKNVTAMEISSLNCDVLKERGVNNVWNADFFEENISKWDTLLFLMNGVGLCGNLEVFKVMLSKCERMLNEGGQIILDSSDVAYLYEDEDINFPENRYYGEVDCAYSYKEQMSEIFTWLYLDFETLKNIAQSEGWKVEKLLEDESDQFLVKLTKF